MNKRTWLIVGATSIIAEAFAHLAAQSGHSLILVGRSEKKLDVIARDLSLRHRIVCDILVVDLSVTVKPLLQLLTEHPEEIDLLLAHALQVNNNELNSHHIDTLLQTNILSTIQLIHAYWQKPQSEQRIIFLSSVAACRGRAKNSLYGASKIAVEHYLEGLEHGAGSHQFIHIIRFGFIDTHLTYGEPGIFYSAAPEDAARACWKAALKKKRHVYYPFFWRFIMLIICRLPLNLYRKLKI